MTTVSTTRRRLFTLLSGGVIAGTMPLVVRSALATPRDLPPITVYKNPSCGCCGQWTDYLIQHGFRPKVVEMDDLEPIRRLARVPDDLAACHTAVTGRYVVEGHVPVQAISKMLSERPKIIGISVPGMPAGSPGMPNQNPERFDVIAFATKGRQRLFMSF